MLAPTRRSWRRWPASPASRKKDTETIVDTVFGSIVHALHRGWSVTSFIMMPFRSVLLTRSCGDRPFLFYSVPIISAPSIAFA